ncbi:CoA transferase [Arthrobacter sp. MA-N2]|uniref:CoA transferase n=1 Tax=Arthrobacter sp. MA-N2 TaxID=1101188 RepID=UPI0004B5DB10|nr:CoA transferase [Arthrobacter sp. MA-N2]
MTPTTPDSQLAAAHRLLAGLGLENDAVELHEAIELGKPALTAQSPAEGWKTSGAAALTAYDTTPPGDIAASLRGAALLAQITSRRIGNELVIDGPALLSERENLCLQPHEAQPGMTLRGGGRILKAADGWLAVNLPRDSDWELVPALSMGAVGPGDEGALAEWTAQQTRRDVVERSALLGLAVGAIPRAGTTRSHPSPYDFRADKQTAQPARPLPSLTVMDLSRLWAGPLAGALMASAGANVVKVESLTQPELSVPEDAAFAHRLNGGKELLQLDFRDRAALGQTLAQADVVIASTRQRAFNSLGLRQRPGQLWISISAYGGHEDPNQRVGYGDDAAAEAGVVCWHQDIPHFAGDALADPVTGLLAAVGGFGLLNAGRSGILRLDLAGAARWAIGKHGWEAESVAS